MYIFLVGLSVCKLGEVTCTTARSWRTEWGAGVQGFGTGRDKRNGKPHTFQAK